MNNQLFTADFFEGNRRRMREALGDERPIVVTANGLLQRGADSAYQFSQDANFWYLTGIEEPDVILVIDGEREFLIAPTREATRETFDGAVDVSAMAERSGIADVLDEINGWNRMDGLLSVAPAVATLANAPTYIAELGMYANPARSRMLERMHKHVENLEVVDIRRELARLRMIKQPAEIAAIQAAIDVTSETLNTLLVDSKLRRYQYEYQLEADITRGFRVGGASGHSFEPIVAGGKRACTLHNVANNVALRSGELIVCDVGAEVSHYAADITRTVCKGKPTQRQRDVYQAVLESQQYALDLLRPGIKLRSYEKKVATFVGRQLKQLGLITTLDTDSIRKYFPHATSHFVGLNVHDVGDYEQPLRAGVVLTCEPGIYIPEEGIGVRLEDDLLVTATGKEVLSTACRKELA
ncbi:Xaa-Pro aminopeptidase [soil metagenome]